MQELSQQNTYENIRKTIKLNPYQDRFIFDDFFKYKFLKAGWATGKSLCLILACVRQCMEYANNLGVIYRKEATDLRDSTIKQFEDVVGVKVSSERNANFKNGSTIMFRHKEDIFGTVQNINMGFAGIEEHAELETDELFYLLFGRVRRENTGMKFFSVGNANGHNWVYRLKQAGVYDLKKDPEKKNRLDLHLEATTYDNAHNLPKEFIDSLSVLKTSKPQMFNRFVMNSDEESDTTDIIINPKWVRAAQRRVLTIQPPIRRCVSIDVARYGDDQTPFYAFEMGARNEVKVLGRETWEKKNTMETVGLATIFARKHGIKPKGDDEDGQGAFAVDEIGVGAGVADRLSELGYQVMFVNSSKRPAQPEKHYNLRAEIYDNGASMLEAEKVQLEADDEDLADQLSWVKYKAVKSNGVFQVEAKEDLKKRVGRSPDHADAFLNGLWALPQVNVNPYKDKYERSRERALASVTEDPMGASF